LPREWFKVDLCTFDDGNDLIMIDRSEKANAFVTLMGLKYLRNKRELFRGMMGQKARPVTSPERLIFFGPLTIF